MNFTTNFKHLSERMEMSPCCLHCVIQESQERTTELVKTDCHLGLVHVFFIRNRFLSNLVPDSLKFKKRLELKGKS